MSTEQQLVAHNTPQFTEMLRQAYAIRPPMNEHEAVLIAQQIHAALRVPTLNETLLTCVRKAQL